MITEEQPIKQSYALCSCSAESAEVGGIYHHRYDRGTLITDYGSGELVCNKCGIVICHTLEDSSQRDLIRGRTSDGIMAACIYMTCREFGNTRTLKDIAAASNLTRRDIAKNYRKLPKSLAQLSLQPTL